MVLTGLFALRREILNGDGLGQERDQLPALLGESLQISTNGLRA
jgi:hypothetical protein